MTALTRASSAVIGPSSPIASFVPDTDKELKRQFEEWGKQNKAKVRLDIIAHLQLQTKKAAEVQAKSGRDLTALGPGLGDAALYFDYFRGTVILTGWAPTG